jgi:hypothetical protein
MRCPMQNYDDAIVRGYIINIFLRLRIVVGKRYSTIETTRIGTYWSCSWNKCHTICFCNDTIIVQFGYIAIETQEAACFGHTIFLFAHLVLHLSYQAENEPAMSNTCHFLCLNSVVYFTTLKWVHWYIYRQSPVPFIQCQVLKITKNICGRFFLVY